MSSNKPDKHNRNRWLALINIPIQMGIIIFAFSWFGGWLDDKFGNVKNTNTIIFTLLGVFVALYNVVRQVNELNK